MKRLLRDKWVGALRSGQFPQGQTRLVRNTDYAHNEVTFCCMGVLCEIASPYTRTELEDAASIHALPYVWIAEQINDRLYFEFLRTNAPDPLSLVKRLAKLNDIDGLTFAEIADWIEVNIPCQD